MKKTIAIILTVSALSLGAFAQAGKAPADIKCAVMTNNKVNVARATKAGMFADYKGRRYYFCCGGCKPQFAKTPAKFAKNSSLAAPKKHA